jgi:hypothetical protein
MTEMIAQTHRCLIGRFSKIPCLLTIAFCATLLSGGATAANPDPLRVVLGHSVVVLNGPWLFHTGEVLMAGVAEEADLWMPSDNPRLVDLRARLPKGQLETYLIALQDVNAIVYIRHAQPRPLLLQFANFEQYFDRASMGRYAAAATEPKTVLFYDSAHELNDPQAFEDRLDWLAKRLSLRR